MLRPRLTIKSSTGAPATPTVAEISDVTLTSISDNELLQYDNASSKWINQTIAEVGLQPLDAELTALAGLTSAANKILRFTGSETAGLLDFKDEDNMASDSATALASQQSIKKYVDDLSSTYQPLDADLTAIAGLTSAADKGIQFTGSGTAGTYDLTTFAKSILDDANEATFKATVNLEIGTDVLAEQTIGIADNNLVEIDGAAVASGEYARFTANGLESRTATEVTAVLDVVVGDSGAGGVKGLAPATGAGDAAAGKYLKADATWATPAGAGDMTAATYDAAGIAEQLVGLVASQTLTNKTLTSPVIKTWDKWNTVSDAWSYASATTITVPAGAASIYQIGDKIKITQTTAKYFYVVAVADVLLTVTGGTDYTVANAAITSPKYSKADNPQGFPGSFTLSAYQSFSMQGRRAEIRGWKFAQGTAAINISDTLTFGVAFTALPIVTVTVAGYANSSPSEVDDLVYSINDKGMVWLIHGEEITITGFKMAGRTEVGFTFANTSYFGYTWIAIGII